MILKLTPKFGLPKHFKVRPCEDACINQVGLLRIYQTKSLRNILAYALYPLDVFFIQDGVAYHKPHSNPK